MHMHSMTSLMASLLPWMITWASNSFTDNGLKRHLQKAIVYGAFCSDKRGWAMGERYTVMQNIKNTEKCFCTSFAMLPYLLWNLVSLNKANGEMIKRYLGVVVKI